MDNYAWKCEHDVHGTIYYDTGTQHRPTAMLIMLLMMLKIGAAYGN